MSNPLWSVILTGLGKTVGVLQVIDPALRAPLAVSLGAIPGALLRYYLTLFSVRWLGTTFPYGTFVINLTGALGMGFLITWMLERAVQSPDLRLLVAVGFLGSYTTFSTYALDTAALVQRGSYAIGLFYWAGSAMLGVAALELGSFLARKFS